MSALRKSPWTLPKYAVQEVNWAGRVLMAAPGTFHYTEDLDTWDRVLAIVSNHRASHSFPLNTFQLTLRKYAREVDPSSLVAQRIKRLSSIQLKLNRFTSMRLSQMQDLGGCRAVVESVAEVRRLKTRYTESGIKHALLSTDDYIAAPQRSGYRGVHLVYSYLSDKNKAYNDLKIEMQLRSRYQHAWATAVETVGTFVRQALKSSIGEEEWLRFFSLMGTAIAQRERTGVVPGTPETRADLRDELEVHARSLRVAQRLAAYNSAMRTLRDDQSAQRGAHYYLLELDPVAGRLQISGFKKNSLEEASEQYLRAEKAVKESPSKDAVLVSVDSMAQLERAYPNYFADTSVFLTLLTQTLAATPRRIEG